MDIHVHHTAVKSPYGRFDIGPSQQPFTTKESHRKARLSGTKILSIRSASANTGGVTDVVLSDGSLWQYSDQTHQWTKLDTGVA